MTRYTVPAPVSVSTTVDGEIRVLEFDGDVEPADAVEESLLRDLVISGLATVAGSAPALEEPAPDEAGSKPGKPRKPTTTPDVEE